MKVRELCIVIESEKWEEEQDGKGIYTLYKMKIKREGNAYIAGRTFAESQKDADF